MKCQDVQDPDHVDPDLISDYDFRFAHWLRSQPRITGTCKWIFHVAEFKTWISHSGPPVLVCTGTGKLASLAGETQPLILLVGCGKSVTAYV